MLYTKKDHIDTRTPLQKIRRTTLYRYLNLSGVECSDNEPADKLRRMVQDEGLGVPIPAKVDEAWFKKIQKERGHAEERVSGSVSGDISQLKRPQLVSLGAKLKIKNAIKMKNNALIKAIEEALHENAA